MPKKLRIVSLLLVLLTSGFIVASVALAEGVTILLYHRVGDDRYPSTNVTLEGFRQQLDYISSEGYTVVSNAQVEEYILRGGELPPKAVAIQFDDAFRTVYDNAFPLLKERGWPFAVFVPTESLEKGYGDYATWEMIAEMAASGGEIANHSHSHSRLGAPADGETKEQFLSRMGDEIRLAKEVLLEKGYKPNWLAYPYGEYNREFMKATREAGYALGFAQDPGAVGAGQDPFGLPRYAVVGATSDFKVFKERLGYAPLVLEDMSPDIGMLVDTSPAEFRAKVVNPEKYRSGEINLFVSELGRLEATFDAATGMIVAKSGKPLTRRLNRVLVSLRTKEGRFALTSWSVIKK